MNDRLFVDSNIWIYALIDGAHPHKGDTARRVIAEESIIVLSTQVISEVCYNLIRKAKAEEALVRSLIQDFFLRYSVVPHTEQMFLRASELRTRYSISYWDSLILASALLSGCKKLLSEDKQHCLKVDELEIVNPFSA
ncbi:MAG TPA: PIN domain-containing protein [Candidatus Ozemobacteraceae bacterium]|mgnify:CR=1 FL=1|nr:PIN domain-containing protein [Candidatus Ozemobacteraceae bacterium]